IQAEAAIRDDLLTGVQTCALPIFPAVARQLPRGVALRWSSAPTSVGVQSYRMLYALDDRPIVTGSNLEDAQAQLDPLTQGAIVKIGRASCRERAGGWGVARTWQRQ